MLLYYFELLKLGNSRCKLENALSEILILSSKNNVHSILIKSIQSLKVSFLFRFQIKYNKPVVSLIAILPINKNEKLLKDTLRFIISLNQIDFLEQFRVKNSDTFEIQSF